MMLTSSLSDEPHQSCDHTETDSTLLYCTLTTNSQKLYLCHFMFTSNLQSLSICDQCVTSTWTITAIHSLALERILL
ncbi:hypothetical protein JOB18_029763 [Solea senegalensis]|uniref:Uncharacterized protein n=1 Tax=Solea senegalensis TaxID=28829 RepID=A0AAV6R8I0_SOLSE|nr:hypothetical protein JOB18_029763 [Solea senegalensis]